MGIGTGWRVLSLMILNTWAMSLPNASACCPTGEGAGNRIDEHDFSVSIGGNHAIADAGQRHPQPFLLLLCEVFNAFARLVKTADDSGNGNEQGKIQQRIGLIDIFYREHIPQ